MQWIQTKTLQRGTREIRPVFLGLKMARLFQQAGSVMLPLAYRSYEVFMHKQEVEEDTHTFRPNLCLVRSDYSWAAF